MKKTTNGVSRIVAATVVALGLVLVAGCSDGYGGRVMQSGGGSLVDAAGGGDFTTIQSAVSAAAPGSRIRIAPGTYREQVIVSKTLTLVGMSGAVLELPGAPLAFTDESSDDSSAVLEIRGANGAVVEGLTLSGPQDGILVRDSTDVTLTDVDASDNGDDGVDVRNSSNVSITGRFNSNGDKGVQVRDGSSAVLVQSSELRENADRGIRIRESSTSFLRNSTVVSNGDDGVQVRDSTGVEITGNAVTDNGGYGIRLTGSPDTVTSGNTLSRNVQGDFRSD